MQFGWRRSHRRLQPSRGHVDGQSIAELQMRRAMILLHISGVRSGLDVVRMLALGAKGVLLSRTTAFPLTSGGHAGVEQVLAPFAEP